MEDEIKAEFIKSDFTLEEEEEILKKCKILCLCFSLLKYQMPSLIAEQWNINVTIFDRLGLTFCINYKLTPSDLVSSWEIYYLNRSIALSLILFQCSPRDWNFTKSGQIIWNKFDFVFAEKNPNFNFELPSLHFIDRHKNKRLALCMHTCFMIPAGN